MDLIRLSIERPVAIIAAVLMVITMGLVALEVIPIQLAPDVRKPIISVDTFWFGAAPAEFEREVINRQEDRLKGLEGLEEMSSTSRDSSGEIKLEFNINQNMDRALLLTSNRLDQVENYPDEVDRPTLNTSGSEDSPIAWLIIRRLPGNENNINDYYDFVEDRIKDRLERVPGVARSNIYGGSENEMRIVIDPERMASYQITVPEIVTALRKANASITAGDVDEGKRRYVVRTEGKLDTLDTVRNVVLRSAKDPESDRMARTTIGDISDVVLGHKEPRARIRHMGHPAIAINAVRETGANVIEVMDGIRAAITELNATALPEEGLELFQVYDETVYIKSAIDLVTQNIYIGGTLAALLLLLFLRSMRATLIVSLAIPVSVIGSFVAMALLGRSLNVISLAGIAFAIGMVVDAAIVVLENIYRLRQSGHGPAEAAYKGARQVWGAILVSALTTVLVFIPILIMKLEVGQLFRDIAVAISVAVILSLIAAVTVVPALANRLLGEGTDFTKPLYPLPYIDKFAKSFVKFVLAYTKRVTATTTAAISSVGLVCGICVVITLLFLPKLEYLPEGNRNLVFGVVLPPPGYNLDTTTDIAKRIEAQISHLWVPLKKGSTEGEVETSAETEVQSDGPPKIDNFFFVARRSQTYIGASSIEPDRVAELIPVLSAPAFEEPGTFGFISQPSLFGRGIGGGRSIDLNVSGPDLEAVLAIALKAAGLIENALPRRQGNQLRPKPGLELGAPEVRVTPDPVRLADNDMNATEFGMTLNAFNDGLRVDEITFEGKRIDLTLRGPIKNVTETQGIGNLPIVTPDGHILPASSLANIEVTAGPTEIRHLERTRTVTLEIRPSPNLALEVAMEAINEKVIAPLEAQGLPAGTKLSLSGTSDELTRTWDAMLLDLILAVIIVYLVMAILFESFLYPFIILLSVPLATAGGVIGLAGLNLLTFQPLDMLTLLGFVILIGIVVNNAILLVHQSLYHIRVEHMEISQAITEATRNRIRPIFMSTLTSVFGMLPLVLLGGAGSELYRGLGSVVVGGLSMSAILTLLIIPPMLSVFAHAAEGARHLTEHDETKA